MAAFAGRVVGEDRMVSAVWEGFLRPRCREEGETARRSKASLSCLLRRVVGDRGGVARGERLNVGAERPDLGRKIFNGILRVFWWTWGRRSYMFSARSAF